MPEAITDHYNYWLIIFLLMAGLFVTMTSGNLVKKIVGLNVFQMAVFLFFISVAKLEGGTAPILTGKPEQFSNPLPHVLILTAIVVGVATTALGLALVVRIRETYGSIEEARLQEADRQDELRAAAEQGR